ncbi:MAG: hypothetical protein E7455_01045 [Ruminococcaceae bacterium]|nr:hypothetical protein [Oscillospiraceae bacterium]
MRIEYIIGGYDPNAAVSYLLTEKRLVRVRTDEKPGAEGEFLNLYLIINDHTADILNPAVVDAFIHETHETYKARFGSEFSDAIKGFFTDEPEYYRWHTPYTPMIEAYFKDRFDEEILDGLGLLFVEKEGYCQFRYRYWTGMQALMLENFAAKVYGWCEENKVRLTGHYIEETSLAMQLWCCGGCMPFYEYEHIPGIDWLCSGTDNELSVRQLGSVAAQLGKKQAITESFAATGWDASMEELLRIVGFQFAGGVNLLCHHLMPYSERGVRKFDHPAHFHTSNPWVGDHFADFNQIVTRLSCLMTESKEPVNVAMLHPMRSAYLHYKRKVPGHGIEDLEQRLSEACRMLSSRGIAYHFLDETLLARHGFVKGNLIGCGQCQYQYLVLPSILTMDTKTEDLIGAFVRNGGKVLLLGDVPRYLEGNPHSYVYLTSNCTLEEIRAAQPYRVVYLSNQLYYTYRRWGDVPFVFVQNGSADTAYTQTFIFPLEIQSFYALDLKTLQVTRKPLTVTLEANEGMLLFPSEEPCDEVKTKEEYLFRFAQAPVSFMENAMPLDKVFYSLDGQRFEGPIYCNELFRKLLKKRYEGRIILRYKFTVQNIPTRMELVTEDLGDARFNGHRLMFHTQDRDCRKADISALVTLGENIYETAFHWYQNKRIYEILFEESETSGFRNAMTYDTELEPVCLFGDFGVYSTEPMVEEGPQYVSGSEFAIGRKPEIITEPVLDGMPFFRGKFTVTQDITLADPNVVLLVEGRYQVAEVVVNGEKIALPVKYGRVDISSLARIGVNHISVTYTVGNRNLLGPLHYAGNEDAVGVFCFETFDFKKDEKGICQYKLCRFYKNSAALGGEKQ